MEWRIFCAIELPADLRAQLTDHIRRLRETVTDVSVSWSRPENSHLTLKFFGNVSTEHIGRISTAAGRTSSKFAQFPIQVGNTGVFPKSAKAQVLWIGVSDPAGALIALQKSFEEECARAGFAKEERNFRPHLTIARIRQREGTRQLAEAHLSMEFPLLEVSVSELVVFRSELSSEGSKYTPLSRHPLSQSLKTNI
jgi:2'-5' RNA ligase